MYLAATGAAGRSNARNSTEEVSKADIPQKLIGHYPDYVGLSNKLSTKSFSTPENIWNLQELKILWVWKYNPKCKNLCELNSFSSLEELYITQSSITSLKGCGAFGKLRKLELSYLNKLEYIDEIELNSDTLKYLRFDACKKIKNHDYVCHLPNLELLAFDECNEVPSVSFIRDLPKLKSFIFVGTNVVDGDLSACTGLEYVGFLNKRHYLKI